MKLYLLFHLGMSVLLSSCGHSPTQNFQEKNGFTLLPEKAKQEKLANFAGGCFWSLQECFLELKGVNKVVSGYAGGKTQHPSYETVITKTTGHAETVQVYYDPRVISFETLTAVFFQVHDPTQVDRQGPDIGNEYRSIAFHRTTEEYKIIRKIIDQIDRKNPAAAPVVTEITPFTIFYPAETEHQDYYVKNPLSLYIRRISKPKVMQLRAKYPNLIKDEYIK